METTTTLNIKDKDMATEATANGFAFYFCQKINKLSKAIYLVSEFISDADPLKWKLRDKSLSLIELSLGIYQAETSHNLSDKTKISAEDRLRLQGLSVKINEMISLLDLALINHSLSQMNFSILLDEYRKLKNYLVDEGVYRQQMGDLTKVELPVPDSLTRAGSLLLVAEKINKGQVADLPDSQRTSGVVKSKKGESDQQINRREQIVRLVRGHGWTSIKDISSAIKGCGTKTVQRELAGMVKDGVLQKKGDRRWSRYLLSE